MKLRVFFIMTILMFFGITSLPSPENTDDKEHPFSQHLISIYSKYLKFVREGDVSSALSYMIAEYAQMNNLITADLLKEMSADELDPQESVFVRVDASQDISRLVYYKADKDYKSWQAIVFKLESGKWKIAKIIKYGTNIESEEDVLKSLISDTDHYFQKHN
ncbi:MAG: hypothetical protein N3A59_03700 [Thermodesulfovibrionales bacterium]|nr:hypothetical protein [Thermodesulfovibrionales bacterium]